MMKRRNELKTYFGLDFIATSEETNGKYFLCETKILPGDSGPPPHTHASEDEGFYIKKGKLRFNIDGKEVEVNEGEFINIQKGEKHTWVNDSGKAAELLITFAPAGIEQMFIKLERDVGRIKDIGMKYGTDFQMT